MGAILVGGAAVGVMADFVAVAVAIGEGVKVGQGRSASAGASAIAHVVAKTSRAV